MCRRSAVWAVLLMLLCSCASRERIVRPVCITEETFPLGDAAALVEALEAPAPTLISTKEASWGELLEYGKQSALFSPETPQSLLWEWLDLGIKPEDAGEIPAEQLFKLDTQLVYPTVYHQDVSVIQATVRITAYEERYSGLNREELLVTEAYAGTEPFLKGFERVYVFEKSRDGVWEFSEFSGVGVYSFDPEITIPLRAEQ